MVQDALSEYSVAVRLSPGVVDSRFFSDLKRRLPSEAEEAVGAAITDLEARAESDPVLKARLGKLYLYRGRTEALETLRGVTAELPNLPRPWFHLGILQERQSEYEEARRSFDRAVFLGGDYLPLVQLGRLHDRAGRTAEAIAYYQSAIARWRWKGSESSRNIRRMYMTAEIVSDNVVPRGFLSYVEPDFDLGGTCSRLASLHLTSGNPEQAAYYDELGKSADFQFRIAR
jgi:tetratricopeptide (TPR) repeat protein